MLRLITVLALARISVADLDAAVSHASLKQSIGPRKVPKVPDAFLCPAGHRMKLHNGSRREGPLTCDGDPDVCCGRDDDGIIHVGCPRYSCEPCDFDSALRRG